MRIITTSPHRGIAEGDKKADETGVLKTPVIPNFDAGIVGFLIHYTSFMIGAVLRAGGMIPFKWRPDVVWSTSPPLFTGIAGSIIARMFSVPHVLDIRDLWPDAAVAVGEIGDGGRAFRIGKILESWCYQQSAALTCTTAMQQTTLKERSGKSVSVVYNGVPRSMVASSVPGPPARRIVYAGNIGRAQGIEHLIKAVARVSSFLSETGWTVEIVGQGARLTDVEHLVTSLGLGAIVRLHSPMPKQDVMAWLTRSGILFLNLVDGHTFASAIPSKIFDYLAASRPILAGVAGESREILEKTGANLCVTPGSVDSISAGLVRMIESYDEFNMRAAANADLARSKFTREAATDELERALLAAVER